MNNITKYINKKLISMYKNKTGKAGTGYSLFSFFLFFIIFPLMFFMLGGYTSGMQVLFVLAMVYTVILINGSKAWVIVFLKAVLYSACIWIAYENPDYIKDFRNDYTNIIQLIFILIMTGLFLSLTFHVFFKIYYARKVNLEEARLDAINSSQAKMALLTNMSHEIKTPINTVLGMNEMIRRENASENSVMYSESIRKSGEFLLQLINDILDVSRIEAGKMALLINEYETEKLIKELSLIGEEQTKLKNLEFYCECDKGIPAVLEGDYLRIKQIIINFLSNAAKYTKEGSVTLKISAEVQNVFTKSEESDEILLNISVHDTGVGIQDDDNHQLFSAFSRIDLLHNQSIEGTGLGLAISKELADLMGAVIGFESKTGEGSTFYLNVKQRIVDNTPIADYEGKTVEKASAQSFIAPSARILVVDDNYDNIQVVTSLLEHTEMNIDTALSGHECIEMVKKKDYHLILMDIMMPQLSGIETLKILKNKRNIIAPVVALTAVTITDTKQILLDEGFAAYIGKPVKPYVLEKTIAELLPKDIVIYSNKASESFEFDRHLINEIAGQLVMYDIYLHEALKLLNGDIILYKKLAIFFITNYNDNMALLETLFVNKDIKNLTYQIHSLKSRANTLGATDLNILSKNLEIHCIAGDMVYVETSKELLMFELDRVYQGLQKLCGFLKDTEEEHSDEKIHLSKQEILDNIKNLQTYLSENNHNDSMNLINLLKNSLNRKSEQSIISRAFECIKKFDFEEAAVIITELLELIEEA